MTFWEYMDLRWTEWAIGCGLMIVALPLLILLRHIKERIEDSQD